MRFAAHAVIGAVLIQGAVQTAPLTWAADPDAAIQQSLTFYASFDRSTDADFGRGDLKLWTRYDHPSERGKTIAQPGFDEKLVKLDRRWGAQGGSLHLVDVQPRNGFVFYRVGRNFATKANGWGGTASIWVKADPNLLKTPHCDPIQIVEKRYNDGAIWCDFDEDRPRDLRLGLFRSLHSGEAPPMVPDRQQPIAWAKDPPFTPDDWHHLAITWENIGTGQKDARATLFLDGLPIANLAGLEVDIQWHVENVRYFIGAALIGWLDEAALFDRPLSADEVRRLAASPALLAGRRNDP